MIYASSLEPGQDQRFAGPDLELSCLTLWFSSWKNILKKVMLKKSADDIKKW